MQTPECCRTLLIAQLVMLGSFACDRQPAVVGIVYRSPSPSVIDVVREAVADWPGGPPAEIRTPSSQLATHAEREVEGAAQLTALQGIVAVVGHQDSRTTLLAAPVYDEAQVPLIVPTATSRAVATASPWIFPLAPNDSQEGAFIARFAAKALGAHTVSLLYDNDEYGRGLRDGLTAALADLGLRITAEAPIGTVCEAAEGDASLALVAPRRHPPDVLVIAGRPLDSGCIVRQVSSRSPGIQFIVGDAVEIREDVVAAMGPALDSTYFVAFWHDGLTDERSVAFTRVYRRIVGATPTPGTAMQYDALMLLMQAVRDVGTSPKAIQSYLTQLGRSRPPFEGATGRITFGAERHRPLYMLRVRHGVASVVPVP